MKKILFAILAASALFAGCDPHGKGRPADHAAEAKLECEPLGQDADGNLYALVRVKGHEYLSAAGMRSIALVHAESCPCKAKK